MARAFLMALLVSAAPSWAATRAEVEPDSTGPPPASLVRALGRIQAASDLRVKAGTRGLFEGTFERWDVHSLRLRGLPEETEIPLSSVRGLWVRGRATGHGAKVGAIVAGILGAAVGASTVALGRGLAEGGGPDGFRGNYLGMAVAGACAGGAIGALAGAGIGAAFPRWIRRFP